MKIRISHYAFDIGSPFKVGHVLTESEALELNRVRAENIRNNVRRWVVEASSGLSGLELLPASEIAALGQRIESYARSYDFPLNRERPKITFFEFELRNLAAELVEKEMAAFETLPRPEIIDLAIEARMKEEAVIEEARRRAIKKSQVAGNELELLGLE